MLWEGNAKLKEYNTRYNKIARHVFKPMKPEKVAQKIVEASRKRKRKVFIPWVGRLFAMYCILCTGSSNRVMIKNTP